MIKYVLAIVASMLTYGVAHADKSIHKVLCLTDYWDVIDDGQRWVIWGPSPM